MEEYVLLDLESSVCSNYKRRALFRVLLGTLLWFSGNYYFDIPLLSFLGFLVYITAFVLIATGFNRYRKLYALAKNPHSIILTDFDLIFFYKGFLSFRVPLSIINTIGYGSQVNVYGIYFKIEKETSTRIIVNGILGLSYLKKVVVNAGVFFPHFSKKTYMLLKKELLKIQEMHDIKKAKKAKKINTKQSKKR
ncbi:MAG: hypothetical protein H0W50_02070 [Parachlamydiaceae bacterium]|nr:hypothetical protein [Parachlamydiaceae bacterium]